jgi:hypothetical protein
LGETSCSVADELTEGGAVISTHILARCATVILAGSLHASTSEIVSGAATALSYTLVEMHFGKLPLR